MRPYYSPLACGTKWALLSKRPMCASTFVLLFRVFLSYGLKKNGGDPKERVVPELPCGKELSSFCVRSSSMSISEGANGLWCSHFICYSSQWWVMRSPSLSSRLSTVAGKNAVKNSRVPPPSSLTPKISPQQPGPSLHPWKFSSNTRPQSKLSYSAALLETPQGKLPAALSGFILWSLQLESQHPFLPMQQNKSTQVNSNFTGHR